MKRLFFAYAFCLLGFAAGAQNAGYSAGTSPVKASAQASVEVSDLTRLSADDYLNLQLPPLGVLLDNARQNPDLRYFELQVDQEQSELRSTRRTWLKYFKLNGGYQYGMVNNLASVAEGLDPFVYSARKQSLYNVGASLSFPLDEIFDRRNRIKRQKFKIEQAKANAERGSDELTMKVIDSYTAALEQLSLIRTKSEAATLASAQYKLSESDFVNGKIDAQTLSRQKNIESAALREYEETRSMLNNALLKLEILTRTKLVNP